MATTSTMSIEGADEIFDIIYIAKRLFDIGKYELVNASFSDLVEHDIYYENMLGLIENIFEHYKCHYYENRYMEIHVVSDPVIVDFYILAGRYGKRNNIADVDNPYIKEAEQIVINNLNISHCLDWMLMGYTEPKRPFHSRLGLFISYDCDCLDFGTLACKLIEIYEWFANRCVELSNLLDETMGGLQLSLLDVMDATDTTALLINVDVDIAKLQKSTLLEDTIRLQEEKDVALLINPILTAPIDERMEVIAA